MTYLAFLAATLCYLFLGPGGPLHRDSWFALLKGPGEVYYCAELRTADVVYLVKVNRNLDQTIKQFLSEDEDDNFERDIDDLESVED